MRYAIYFTPREHDPLSQLAASWLGRDAFTGIGTRQPPQVSRRLLDQTAEPRRYGFHATLKAPFRLADGRTEQALSSAFRTFCAARRPFSLPLAIHRLDGFFALMQTEPSGALDELAADTVRDFEPFRAALTPAEIERRRPERLSAAELRNLVEWGYPQVFDTFRFHMTLTGRVSESDAPQMQEALASLFGPLLREPLSISGLGLFVQRDAPADFTVLEYAAFAAAD